MNRNKGSFTGQLGFVLAAAGSAVGLGNIWRFPYLAAKDGGGAFLFIYLILVLTFGFAMLTTEIAIGRMTKLSSTKAFEKLHKSWKFVGILACIVPFMIYPYYCAIGGWVMKYFVTFITGSGLAAADSKFFGGFITSQWEPVIYMTIFMALCAFFINRGVESGIEKSSKYIMPLLIVLIVAISGFSLTLNYTDAQGVTRTGMEGLKILTIPNFSGYTFTTLLNVIMDAMGQLFYSISVAMGIMISYGAYVRDQENLIKGVNQTEIFDTVVGVMAGVMIIPAVYTFMGMEGMKASGPGLMFVALPKVFASMGSVGTVIGVLFFALVIFAALTSAMSVLEAVVSNIMDVFGAQRKNAVIIESVIGLLLGITVCFGYNIFYFEISLPNGCVAQVLDIMDYISNTLFMPLVGLTTCLLIGWVLGPEIIIKEVTKNGESFERRGLYIVMMKYVAPIMLFVLLLQSAGVMPKF